MFHRTLFSLALRFFLPACALASTIACSSSSSAPTSQSLLAEGAECVNDAQCAPPGDGRTSHCQCVDGKKTSVCTAQLPLGATCPKMGKTYGIGCSGEAECINTKCQIRAALGESCADNLCKKGLSCQSGICADGHKLGEACSEIENDCAAPNHCAFATNKCVPPGKVGDACTGTYSLEPWECESGLGCDAFGTSTCVPLIENGGTCKGPELCKSGVCVYSGGDTGTCQPKTPDEIPASCGAF
jgi:hypothetical protein